MNTHKDSPLVALRKEHFPNVKFPSGVHKMAGKIFKSGGPEATLTYLKGELDKQGTANPPNAQPPAKCNIIAISRPFEEWDVVLTSTRVQTYLYGLTKAEFDALDPNKRTSTESHEEFANITGLDLPFRKGRVQGFNLILKHSANRYLGVEKKVANRNEKRRKAYEGKVKWTQSQGLPLPEEPTYEVAFDSAGKLLTPPGINPNIYCTQNSVTPYVGGRSLPPEYQGYSLDPAAPIPRGVPVDRTTIPQGEPGYLPLRLREKLSGNKHKRMRKAFGKGSEAVVRKALSALLVVVRSGTDWVVCDARGLLRNAHWRKVLPANASLQDLLDLFTGDPVIDPKRRVVTFLYRQGVVKILSKKEIHYKKAPQLFKTWQEKGLSVGLLSVDLGQINLVAARTARLKANGTAESLETFVLEGSQIRDLEAFRRAWDSNEARILSEALRSIPEDALREFQELDNASDFVQQAICRELGLSKEKLPWELMTPHTTHISEAFLLSGGDRRKVEYTPYRNKKGEQKGPVIRRDGGWKALFLPKVSKNAREALNEVLRELKINSEEYQRLSKRKQELARQVVNHCVTKARKRAQTDRFAVVVEDLNPRIMHGKGKYEIGWEAMMRPKKENRWFIPVLLKSFKELASNKGAYVIPVAAHRTSQTCPSCKHVDPANRDLENREKFRCVACGEAFHADLDVATHNILRVALEGQSLPAPAKDPSCEGGKNSRKRKVIPKQKT